MSNVKPFPAIGRIKDEAAEWVVRIHAQVCKSPSGLSDEFVSELNSWLGQSDEHRRQFHRVLGLWDAMGVLEDLAEILPLEDRQGATTSTRRHRRWPLFSFPGKSLIGSGLVAASMIIGLVWFAGQIEEPNEFITEIGQQSSLALEDGSSVQLNTDTRLIVDFSEELRVVRLERGEAHFEVAKDESRPFVVFAGDGMVMAVGTAFNVRHQTDDSVNVIVSEGTVKVFSGVTVRDEEPLLTIDSIVNPIASPADATQSGEADYFREVVLAQGESAQYSQRRVVKDEYENDEFLEELAWKDGVLVFQGETLNEALLEIARYTDRKLIIVDPEIGESSVGGRFKTDDIDALVHSLALGLNIRAATSEDGSILLSAR